MATAKQLAWRKKFAALARSGAFAKNPKKRKPAAKKTVAKKTVRAKPSQITKRAPSSRLKARRAVNTHPGYFPNPDKDMPAQLRAIMAASEWKVSYAKNNRFVGIFNTLDEAKIAAQAIASKNGKQMKIERV